MIRVEDIFKYLCECYPLDTACDFDNPGLLVGDKNSKVTGAIVALDCDIDTINFAVNNGCNLIITHHPVIWDGLKNVTAGSVVFSAIKNGISVISMHTNLDIAKGGVNDCLCRALGLKNVKPFTADDGYLLLSADTDNVNADTLASEFKNRLGYSVRYVDSQKSINRVLVCSGSGGKYLYDALAGGFDALITADVKHDVFTCAINFGISVFDAGHYATECVVIKPLADKLTKEFKYICFKEFYQNKIKSV